MAVQAFVHFGTLGYSRHELEQAALQHLEDGTPQYFHFLVAMETLDTLQTIAGQLEELYQLQLTS